MNQMIKDAVKAVIETGNRPVASRRLRARAAAIDGPVDVVVGSGRVELPGWLNTDASWRARHYLDVTRPWPLREVRHVYADNVIEHLRIDDVRSFLRNAFAAMRPGGWIRLATPDVEAACRLYLDPGSEDFQLAAERQRRAGLRVEHPVDLVRVVFAEHGHHLGYCFDLAALRAELTTAGFVGIERSAVGVSEVPELRGLESRNTEADALLTLVVEAERPV